MPKTRMQYRMQGARMLMGGKSVFVDLPDKLQEVCIVREKFMSIVSSSSSHIRFVRMNFFPNIKTDL